MILSLACWIHSSNRGRIYVFDERAPSLSSVCIALFPLAYRYARKGRILKEERDGASSITVKPVFSKDSV